MSYNSYHKTRGFSTRGSFRGRGDSSGSWSNTSNSRGRGGFSGPSRGRFNWYKDHSSTSFDSRNRYSSGASSGNTERYSSRGRGDDSGYRRYSRGDMPEYSTRDHSHHRSPDSQRKRMRTEHGYVQASSTRRSHDGSYGGGTDYNSRYSYSEDKSYGEERGRGYRDERRSAGSFRDRSREDYPHRKAEQLDSSMPPPSGVPPRHLSSPRGSFRGRISRGARGMSRIMLSRRADTFLARKRTMMDSYTVRKRILTSRTTQAENLRRLKIQKLRRLREAAAKKEGKDKDGSDSKATEDISDDDDKDEPWDEDMEKADDDDDDDDDDEELEEGETPDKKEKVKKVKKEAKTSKDEEPEEGEEVDEDEEDEDEEEDEEDETKKSDVKNNGGVHVTIKQDSDSRAVSEEIRKQRINFHGRPFIRLSCPHCFLRCITFKEYAGHLYSARHINAMRKQSLRHKQTLARMRMTQRQKQRVVEESEEPNMSIRTKFCPICKLNYRQLKSKHQISEYHRAMKKFLMPFCRVCCVGFKSPMLYENHICSLDHIKRKSRLEERMLHIHERSRDDDGSGMEDEDKELNMDNFMILDSVGTVDDAGEDGDSDGEGKGKSDKEKEGEEKKAKTEINLGSEYVKKIEVLFCELCRMYLPRQEQPERALSIHCRTRTHLQRYVRYRDDRALRREAERIHRKELAKENAEKNTDSKKNSDDKKDESMEKMDEDQDSITEKEGVKGDDISGSASKKKEEGGSEVSQSESRAADLSSETAGEARADGDVDLDQDLESGMDDKLWADVDKDLGELLREVEPGNKSSDEDDDSRAEGGRYDRFRYSEKGSVTATDPPSEGDAGETTKTRAGGDEPVEPDTGDSGKDSKKNIDSKPEGETIIKKTSGSGATAVTPTTTTTSN